LSLPNSYTGSIQFKTQGQAEKQQLLYSLKTVVSKNNMVKQISINDEVLEFVHQSLFKIQYPVEIRISETSNISIDYEIKLNKLIQVCIALVIIIAFFSNFELNGFLWFSFVFTIVFYGINIAVIDKYVRNLIYSVVKNQETLEETGEKMTKEQMEWIKDKTKCPACGEDVTEYDKLCPECGLKLKEKVPPLPSTVSKYKAKRIKYFFKQKKP
jgi:rRNA maturation protein Nop10